MRFYDALQLDPSILKRKIAACDTKDEKAYYWIAMAVRSILIVAFAIVFISLLSGIFGSENTPLAVAMFCMMLGIRFVDVYKRQVWYWLPMSLPWRFSTVGSMT